MESNYMIKDLTDKEEILFERLEDAIEYLQFWNHNMELYTRIGNEFMFTTYLSRDEFENL